MSLTNFLVVGTPCCGVPVRQDGTNVVKAPFFRRLTLRSATGTAQRCPYLDSL
jgi:hypothetical protein